MELDKTHIEVETAFRRIQEPVQPCFSLHVVLG